MLSEAEIGQFHREGFLVFERLLGPERLVHYRVLFDALAPPGTISRVRCTSNAFHAESIQIATPCAAAEPGGRPTGENA